MIINNLQNLTVRKYGTSFLEAFGMLPLTYFGARGDNQTDNYANLQVAIDESIERGLSYIFVPEGYYYYKGRLLHLDKIRFIGNCEHAKIFNDDGEIKIYQIGTQLPYLHGRTHINKTISGQGYIDIPLPIKNPVEAIVGFAEDGYYVSDGICLVTGRLLKPNGEYENEGSWSTPPDHPNRPIMVTFTDGDGTEILGTFTSGTMVDLDTIIGGYTIRQLFTTNGRIVQGFCASVGDYENTVQELLVDDNPTIQIRFQPAHSPEPTEEPEWREHLEYLDVYGLNGYFDTGYRLSTDNTIEFKFKAADYPEQSKRFYIAYTPEDNGVKTVGNIGINRVVYAPQEYGNRLSRECRGTYSLRVEMCNIEQQYSPHIYRIDHEDNIARIYIDGAEETSGSEQMLTNGNTLQLFPLENNQDYRLEFYYFKIYEGETLVRDLRPMKVNGEIVLVDYANGGELNGTIYRKLAPAHNQEPSFHEEEDNLWNTPPEPQETP